MSSGGSISHWLEELKAGDRDAARKLWAEYFQRMVDLARRKLHGGTRGADEEDVRIHELLPRRRARPLPRASRP